MLLPSSASKVAPPSTPNTSKYFKVAYQFPQQTFYPRQHKHMILVCHSSRLCKLFVLCDYTLLLHRKNPPQKSSNSSRRCRKASSASMGTTIRGPRARPRKTHEALLNLLWR